MLAQLASAVPDRRGLGVGGERDDTMTPQAKSKEVLALESAIRNFRNDPNHWHNNKRRMHGLPLLRKRSNRKTRFYPTREIYNAVVKAMDAEMGSVITSTIGGLARVSDILDGITNKYFV